MRPPPTLDVATRFNLLAENVTMRRFILKFSDLLGQRKSPPARSKRRLELEVLEDRSLPAVSTFGAITGTAFVDVNGNGVREAREVVLPGITINLTGTTTQGATVSTSTATDAGGTYSFVNVQPGAYQVSTGNGGAFMGGETSPILVVTPGQTVNEDVGFRGLAPQFISLDQFTTETTDANFAYAPAGAGSTPVNPRSNSAPVVKTAIADVTVGKNAADTQIDLAANFSDPDTTNSLVRINTSAGAINLQLFDDQAPQTVANFFDYVNSGRYVNDIFHRHETNGIQVLQGGGFTFNTDPARLDPIANANDFMIQNEPDFVNRSNVAGTIATAKTSDPNSATSQFFFNLANNSTALNNTANSGGFTVFGKVADAASQQVINTLAALPIIDESTGPGLPPSQQGPPTKGVFNAIPLANYTGSNFPTDTTAKNYALIQNMQVIRRDEFLTYAVVGNTNPGLVTTTVTNEHLTLHYAEDATGTATITVRATDTFGATVDTSFNVSVDNQAPTASVTLNASAPQTNDTLTATATRSDPNGDPVSLTYVWKVNGTVQQTTTTSATTDTFNLGLANHGNKGDTVTVTVTPSDGGLTGVTSTPASATIVNSPPSISLLALSPGVVHPTDMVTANISAADPDGDTVLFTYVWQVNSNIVRTMPGTQNTSDTLDLNSVSPTVVSGDSVSVAVTPNDGTVNGGTMSTNVIVS